MKLIYEFTEGLDYPVSIAQCHDNTYIVIYGAERHEGLDYSRAYKQLGACLMHSLKCAGRFPYEDKYL